MERSAAGAATPSVWRRRALGLVLAWTLVACDSGGSDGATPAATQPSSPDATPARDLRSGSCRAEWTSSRADYDGRSGEFAVRLYEVDVAARALAFDVIQLLVGDDARREIQRQNLGDTYGPPEDYMIVNADERLDRATVTATAGVYVLAPDNASLVATTLEQLAPPVGGGRGHGLGFFWLTFQDGVVKDICQQFTP